MFSEEAKLMTSKLVCVPSTYHARQTVEWLDTEDIQLQPVCLQTKACNSSYLPAYAAHIERTSRFQI